MDHVLAPINDFSKEEHTGSSRYASAESEEESNDSFEIQRMSLETKGAGLLQQKFKRNGAKAQAGKPAATQFMNMVESDQANSYFLAAMKIYELKQARMNAGRSANRHPEAEIYIPDTDMESVRSRLSGSNNHDRERRDQGRRDYRRWRQQERRRVVDSLAKEFECLPWPN